MTGKVERGAPVHCFTSRDGEAQIKLVPVIQGDRVISWYVALWQQGKQQQPPITAEVNLSKDQLRQLGFNMIAAAG